jgi:D-alanine-D-alanine ligase
VQTSAVAIDKLVTKRLWVWAGIPTPAWRELEADSDFDAVARDLGGPVVVKPRTEGSTIGITKVTSNAPGELARAYAEARRYDSRVFAEELVAGRELTCAILGGGASAEALPLIEIRAPAGNYDYQNKYFKDDTQYLCPAPVDATLAREIQRVCLQAYTVVGARGWGRVDVMLKPRAGGDQPLLLELNTSPGMTGHSLVPMAARARGMDFADLVVRILSEATLEVT